MRARLTLVMVLCLALAACASVLGLGRTSPSRPFEHRAHVDKGVSCVQCHAGMGAADAKLKLHLPTTADCRRCHQKPHDERTCSGCHGEAHVRAETELARSHSRFEHGPHLRAAKGDCVRCHLGAGEARAAVLRPSMATCFGCHEHQGDWRARDCDRCHVDLARESTPPSSHLVHEGDFVREHGVRAAGARDLCAACHSERQCAGCHGAKTAPGLPARLRFDEIRLSGLHRAGFRSRHAEEARAQPGMCTTCHADGACVECHQRTRVAPGIAPRSPHPAGWISASRGSLHGPEARRDPAACAGCHGGAGEQLCVGCHKVGGAGGSPHGRGFTSTKDRLRDQPCRMCHGVGP